MSCLGHRAPKRARLLSLIRNLINDRQGGVMTYAALIMPVIVGVAGLSVDVSSWHLQRKALRAAADGAAIAGSLRLRGEGPWLC